MSEKSTPILIAGFGNAVDITGIIHKTLAPITVKAYVLPFINNEAFLGEFQNYLNQVKFNTPLFILSERSNGSMGNGRSLVEKISRTVEDPKILLISKLKPISDIVTKNFPRVHYVCWNGGDSEILQKNLQGLLVAG